MTFCWTGNTSCAFSAISFVTRHSCSRRWSTWCCSAGIFFFRGFQASSTRSFAGCGIFGHCRRCDKALRVYVVKTGPNAGKFWVRCPNFWSRTKCWSGLEFKGDVDSDLIRFGQKDQPCIGGAQVVAPVTAFFSKVFLLVSDVLSWSSYKGRHELISSHSGHRASSGLWPCPDRAFLAQHASARIGCRKKWADQKTLQGAVEVDGTFVTRFYISKDNELFADQITKVQNRH